MNMNNYSIQLLNNFPILNFLINEKKLSKESIEHFNLGLCINEPISMYNKRLLFPITNEYGEFVTYQGRALFDYKSENVPKYWHGKFNNHKKSLCTFGLSAQLEKIVKSNLVVVTEGPMDAMTWYQIGIPSISVQGTALNTETALMLRKYANTCVVCFDNDEAGHLATERAVEVLNKLNYPNFAVKYKTNDKDPNDIYIKYGKEGLVNLLK